jgi:hypothetical protein
LRCVSVGITDGFGNFRHRIVAWSPSSEIVHPTLRKCAKDGAPWRTSHPFARARTSEIVHPTLRKCAKDGAPGRTSHPFARARTSEIVHPTLRKYAKDGAPRRTSHPSREHERVRSYIPPFANARRMGHPGVHPAPSREHGGWAAGKDGTGAFRSVLRLVEQCLLPAVQILFGVGCGLFPVFSMPVRVEASPRLLS